MADRPDPKVEGYAAIQSFRSFSHRVHNSNLRHLEEMMAERDISVHDATVRGWRLLQAVM
jgi:transposase-like protein